MPHQDTTKNNVHSSLVFWRRIGSKELLGGLQIFIVAERLPMLFNHSLEILKNPIQASFRIYHTRFRFLEHFLLLLHVVEFRPRGLHL